MNNPKITVLMSAYNAEKYLAEALESIMNQTYQDFELVIVNDGSTDKTEAIIQEYATKDKRIVVINNSVNQGLTKSLNLGLAQARGEYVARLDADDVAWPERLAKQYQFMESHPELALIGSWAEIIDEQGASKGYLRGETDEALFRFKMTLVNQLVHSTFFFKTELARAQGGYNEAYQYVQDYEFSSRLMKKYRLNNQPEVLVKFRTHAKAITKNKEIKEAYQDYALKVIRDNLQSLIKIDQPTFERLARALIIKNTDQRLRWTDYREIKNILTELREAVTRSYTWGTPNQEALRQGQKDWQKIARKKFLKSQWPKLYNFLKITRKKC